MQNQSTHNDHFIGEIHTYISGMQYCEGEIFSDEDVFLERDYINRHDHNAIRIKNLDSQDIGFVPRRVALWLSPLWDDGKIIVNGTIPKNNQSSSNTAVRSPRFRGSAVNLKLYLTDKGRSIFETKQTIHNEPEALHHIILSIFSEISVYKNLSLVDQLQQKLFGLLTRHALPETHLILSLFPFTAQKIYQTQYQERTHAIQNYLKALTIAPGIYHKNLTVFPILSNNGCHTQYALLNRALKNKAVEIEEISEEGHVHEVLLKNKSSIPVLLPEGEILIGAKQNRVINVSILAAADSQTCIPVSCVERGRWRYSSEKFESTAYAHSKLRSGKLKSVHHNRSKTGESRSDQGKVWDEVSLHLELMNVNSATDSLVDGFVSSEKKKPNFLNQINLPKHTAGVVVCMGDQILGLDYYAKPDHFQEYWKKLSQSYFNEAALCSKQMQPTKSKLVKHFVESISDNIMMCDQSIGLGDEFMVDSQQMTGTGIWYEDQLCHFSAFSVKES